MNKFKELQSQLEEKEKGSIIDDEIEEYYEL